MNLAAAVRSGMPVRPLLLPSSLSPLFLLMSGGAANCALSHFLSTSAMPSHAASAMLGLVVWLRVLG